MLKILDVPLEVLNRTLDLYGEPRETTTKAALAAIISAEARLNVTPAFEGILPFAQAIAEYMSLSGPFNEIDGEFAGVNGYKLSI
jgi:hypothetical protein